MTSPTNYVAGQRLAVAALVASPLLMLAAMLVQASPDAHDTGSELTSIAAAPGRATLSAAVGFVGLCLALPAFRALAAELRRTRPRWAGLGEVLTTTGVLALVALIASQPLTVAMAQSPARAAMVTATDRAESSPLVGVWVGLMLLGYTLGPVVLAVGLWRSGWSGLVPTALVVGVVLLAADAGRWPLAAGYGATAVGLGLAARQLLVLRAGTARAARGPAAARVTASGGS